MVAISKMAKAKPYSETTPWSYNEKPGSRTGAQPNSFRGLQIVDDGPEISTAKARRDLGWLPGFRVAA